MSLLGANSRLLLAVVSVVIAAIYYYNATLIRVPLMGDPIGPKTFPTILSGAMVLTAIMLVFEHVRLRATAAPRQKGEPDTEEVRIEWIAIAAVALFALYLVLFRPLGFILASALFLVIFLAITNRGKWVLNAAIAIGLPVLFYILLGKIFGARLPQGPLTFW